MDYTEIDIPRSSKSAAGAPENRDPNIIIIATDGVSVEPPRDGKGVRYDGNYVFLAGRYANKIYATSSSIKATKAFDGDEDAIGINQGLEFAHPGDSLELNEFAQNWLNKNCIVMVKTDACGTGSPYYKVYGSKCTPLQLKLEGQDDNDATKNVFKFEAFKKTDRVPGFYYGTLTFATVLATIAADAATVDVTLGSGEYQLTTGGIAAAALTDLVNGSHGDVITLLGSGGGFPSTIASAAAKFELLDGTDWTANAGESITFKGYKNGPTAADILWIEVSRQ